MDNIIEYLKTLEDFTQLVIIILCFMLISRLLKVIASIFNSIFGPSIVYLDRPTDEEEDDE